MTLLRSKVFVLVLCLLPLIPIWYFDYLPLQDYPNHLARLTILSDYEHSDFYKNNFSIKFFKGILPLPYLTLDIFVNKFLYFIDTDKAMKVFISLYIILYILSLYLLARHLKQDFALLMLINLPIIYSWCFYLGFLDFIFSIPLFLFSVWAIEKYEMNKNKLNIFLIGLLSILIYLTHIFTFFVFCIFLLCYLFTRRLNIREYIYLIAAISLSLFLGIKFGLVCVPKITISPFVKKFLGSFSIFFNLPLNLFVINSSLFACAIYIIMRNSSLHKKLYLTSSIVFLLVYLILPRTVNGTEAYIDVRALLFSLILVPFSLQIKNSRHVEFAKLVLIVVFFVSFSWLLISFSNLNKNFSTKCADQIERRSVILPVDATQPEGSLGGITPYLHSWGYFLKHKEILTPYLFQHTHIPIKYKYKPPAPSEYWAMFGNKEIAPEFMDKIRETYDYVLLVGNDSKVEGLIDSISFKICSDRLVSLYKIEKDRK